MKTIAVKGAGGPLRVCILHEEVMGELGQLFVRSALACGDRPEKVLVRVGNTFITFTGMRTSAEFRNFDLDPGVELLAETGWLCRCQDLQLNDAPVVDGQEVLNDLWKRFAPANVQKAA